MKHAAERMAETEAALGDRLFALGRDVLSRDVEARDALGAAEESVWRPGYRAAAEAGIFRLAMPKDLGGDGHSVLTTVRALRRLGEGCRDNGVLLAIGGQVWAIQMSILQFARDDQRALLPRMMEGDLICCHAVTERDSGSNAMAIQTRADKVAGGYRISGEKIWIGMAPAAGLAQLFAVTDPSRGSWGLSVFLVDLTQPGVTRGPCYDKASFRTEPAGTLTFDNVFVPEEARLGPEGAGQSIFNRSIEWERRFIFAAFVGVMKRQLDEAVAFAKARKPGGTPIISHQSVSNRLADMFVRYETARLLTEQAAREMDAGSGSHLTGPAVKLHVSEAFWQNCQDAFRIGGSAFCVRGEAERMLRDAAAMVTLGGTSDIQRKIIGALL